MEYIEDLGNPRSRRSQRSWTRMFRRSRIVSGILGVSRKIQLTGYYWTVQKIYQAFRLYFLIPQGFISFKTNTNMELLEHSLS